jgi:hypothetical protein
MFSHKLKRNCAANKAKRPEKNGNEDRTNWQMSIFKAPKWGGQ